MSLILNFPHSSKSHFYSLPLEACPLSYFPHEVKSDFND